MKFTTYTLNLKDYFETPKKVIPDKYLKVPDNIILKADILWLDNSQAMTSYTFINNTSKAIKKRYEQSLFDDRLKANKAI